MASDESSGGDSEDGPVKSVRLAVHGEHLDPDDPLQYLVLLATEARRYDGAWDGDSMGAAKWTVAQWCQELRWAPNLHDVEIGEMVAKEPQGERLEAAFNPPVEYPIDRGDLETARAAGAHDEFVAFVAEYPESGAAETLETAISMDALDEFTSLAGSWDGALWSDGVKQAGNPDKANAKRVRELFPPERWPEWMQQRYADGESEESEP